MSKIKKKIIDAIIKIEGGFVDDESDSGGETNMGITILVARKAGYKGDMRDLPRETVFAIYADRYWNSVMADDLAALDPFIAEEVVDTGVNCGIYKAAEFLQTALNVFNRQGKLYNDVKVDGYIGIKTIYALDMYLRVRDGQVMVKLLNHLQGSFYAHLALTRQKDEENVYGWILNRT